MPRYKYTAIDAEGNTVRGTLEAESPQALYDAMKLENRTVTDFKKANNFGVGSVKLKAPQVADFCRQLGTLLGAGVSLIRALNIIAGEDGLKPEIKNVYTEILRLLRQGVSFSDALEAQGEAFPILLINMFRSAEASGRIDLTAEKMAVHYEKEHRLNGKVKSAATYPIILLVLVVVVVLFLFTFILPQFAELFSEMVLPLPTRIVMGISDGLKAHWLAILIVTAMIVYVGRIVIKLPKVAYYKDMIKVKMPKIGKLLQIIYTARFARTLSSLYASGLPIITSLQIGKGTVGNVYISEQFDKAVAHVRQGETLSSGIEMINGFQKKLSASIAIGEETGNLDTMLDVTAETYDYESEQAISALVAILEPLLIVIMAGVVGFILLSVMLPLIGSYSTIG